MAGQRQPIDLVIMNGKKNLTKAEIKERREREVRAPSDKVNPPKDLPPDLKKEFRAIAKQLQDVNLISNLDIDALVRYLRSRKMYQTVIDIIDKEPEAVLNKEILIAQDKLFKQCRCAAADLGLTISSRCKLVIPKKDDKKNKFEEYAHERNRKVR